MSELAKNFFDVDHPGPAFSWKRPYGHLDRSILRGLRLYSPHFGPVDDVGYVPDWYWIIRPEETRQ